MGRVHTKWAGIIKHLLDRTSPNIIFIWSYKVILGLGFASPNITLHDQINMILVSVLSNKCIILWPSLRASFQKTFCSILYTVNQFSHTQFVEVFVMQCNPIQSNPIQSNPIQYNTIQYNTIQYNSVHCSPIIRRLHNKKCLILCSTQSEKTGVRRYRSNNIHKIRNFFITGRQLS